jgi:hypothetical protein
MEISMASVKKVMYKHEGMRYCPDWLAGEKCGRSKKNDKTMTVIDHNEAFSKKKRKRRVNCTAQSARGGIIQHITVITNLLNCHLDRTFEALDGTF